MSSIVIQTTGSLFATVISLSWQLPKLHSICGGGFKLNVSYFKYRRTLWQAALPRFIKIRQLIATALTWRHTSKENRQTDTAPQ